MSHPRQWTVGIGIVTALVFGTALVIKIRPQIDLVAVGSRAPEFRATSLATGRRVTLADYRGRSSSSMCGRRGASRAASRCPPWSACINGSAEGRTSRSWR